jgi:hypothetical protein
VFAAGVRGGRAARRKEPPMFEPVFENLRKVTEATVHAQQELFQKWISLWPGVPTTPPGGVQPPKFYKKCAENFHDALKRQREFVEGQFKVGLENIEKAFALGEVKTPEEMRVKVAELCKKCFENLRYAFDAQVKELQVAADKWVEMFTKNAA